MISKVTGLLSVSGIHSVVQGDTSDFDRVVTVCQNDVRDNVSGSYSWFNLADGEPSELSGGLCEYDLFESAADCVVGSIRAGERTLVHCHAGQSRSVLVATAALAVTEGLSYDTAFRRVRAARGTVHPNPDLRLFAQRYIRKNK